MSHMGLPNVSSCWQEVWLRLDACATDSTTAAPAASVAQHCTLLTCAFALHSPAIQPPALLTQLSCSPRPSYCLVLVVAVPWRRRACSPWASCWSASPAAC